jgi:hypothetical protein
MNRASPEQQFDAEGWHVRRRLKVEAILSERGILLAMLIGTPKRDRADVEQAVMVSAWRAVRRGDHDSMTEANSLRRLRRCAPLDRLDELLPDSWARSSSAAPIAADAP